MSTIVMNAPGQSIEQATEKVELFVRPIAYLLERHLESANTHVHWVTVSGRESSWGPAKLTWPDDANLAFAFMQGYSEGVLVKVLHMADRYDDTKVIPLMTIKFLCSMKMLMEQAIHITEFFQNLDIVKLRAIQDTPEKYV